MKAEKMNPTKMKTAQNASYSDMTPEELLPFYHTARLPEAQRQRVEDVLKEDAELRRRLTLIEEEASTSDMLNEALGAPSPRTLEALMAKIEAQPRQAAHVLAATRNGVIERFGAMLAALSPRSLAYACAAAIALIALQGVMLTGLLTPTGQPARYQSASAPNSSGSYVLVSFVPQASAEKIAQVLGAAQASIVEGPRASGLYRIRLSEKALPKEDVTRILNQLLAAPGVIAFAAPES